MFTYNYFKLPYGFTSTVGVSYDSFQEADLKVDKVNPKLGLDWQVNEYLRFRAAAFRAVKRALATDQTIEPTQVAGFNQFFDDFNGAVAWRYGIGVDARLTDGLYAGVETSLRNVDEPVFERLEDHDEEFYRTYLYWAPRPRWAISAEFEFDRFKNNHEPENEEFPQSVDLLSVPVSVFYFHPTGVFAELGVTYVRDKVDRLRPTESIVPKGSDEFVLLDAALGYRLPKRRGMLSLEGLNLLDENFGFEDDNFRIAEPRNSRFIPGHTVLARVTLSF
jgi:outer membrane receptor protein involved in Fe transport